MAYYDAISNAIAARGNALAQAAQQQGQVYGNLASNLGQLPFQAMQAGQRRRALEVETQQRAAQTETIQRKLDFEKAAYKIINDPSKSEQQKDLEMRTLFKSDPEMNLKLQDVEQQNQQRNRQYELEKAAKDFTMRSGLPGTEFERPITPPAAGNAFTPEMQPQIPVPQRQMEFETMVHPMNALGIRPPTDVDVRERQAATDALAMNKYAAQQKILEEDREALERLRQQGRTDKPITAADTDVRMENGVPVTYQFNPETQRFDIRVGQARPLQMPPASAAITTEDVDYWKQMIETGQAKLTDVPVMQRGKVNKALAQGGNLNIPPKIREQVNGVDRAISLLAPVKELVEKIIAGEDVITNSALLENYTNSVGTLLSRSLGERGVATEGDVKRATGLVAGWKAANFAPEFARREMALLEGILGSQKKALTTDYFKAVPSGGGPAAPTSGGGLDPQKKARLEELRRKKAAGTLGR